MGKEDEIVNRKNMFKRIFEQHIVRSKKRAKINLRIVYGSEGFTTYRKAKEFLNELIHFFKDIENICNEINGIITKEGGDHYTANGKVNEVDHDDNADSDHNAVSDHNADSDDGGLMDYFKEYSKLLEKKKSGGEREQINSLHADDEKEQNGGIKEFEKRRNKCSNNFVNYADICINTNICTVNFDFLNGNEFNDYNFLENTNEYDLNVLLLFVSTSSYGSFPSNCYKFEQLLEDLHNDFRIEKNFLKNIFYSCIGFGNKQYGNNYFCAPAKKCDKYLSNLGAQRLFKTLKFCDEENNEDLFHIWKCSIFKTISLGILFYCFNYTQLFTFMSYADRKIYSSLHHYCFFFSAKANSKWIKGKDSKIKRKTEIIPIRLTQAGKNPLEIEYSHEPSEKNNLQMLNQSKLDHALRNGGSNNATLNECEKYITDVRKPPNINECEDEATNNTIPNGRRERENNDNHSSSISVCSSGDELEDLITDKPKDMLSSKQRNKLVKEGYKIIGSHSAVKLCRWTKSQLRGRGGCYKHTFYGINSYQCMEATPSLACANKCVFCWRHHKNPVGTGWKWNKDAAEMIVAEGIEKHKGMIKELKGAHGVIKERFDNAMNVRHCALSLVGEPIMYPDINKLIDELHSKNISTFLVTNAQFPNELQKLHKVTQLYLSIDASNEEALKNIDRPLFKDFWDRYIKCIKLLRKRKERTVFRFTLVKEYNMMNDEILSYSKLIEYGYPDFIEIKAVTYCGSSDGYQLTMKNIPWHEEVYQFAYNLIHANSYLLDTYEIACEHRHSCSILIAKKIFKINNKWHTWINYETFQFLVKHNKDFTATDYCAETPSWAIVGAEERGFNPCDERVYTKGKKKNKAPHTEDNNVQ
ncbi:hypothetical protein, conserved [Plasmodium gonderi]|uniref:tRNA 4-demethylwyosine synthase (AdoMet-dependent) n=1 Tax=Plasmodium gonderi TaxID=77519 RepID=A0A1Y1JI54_PLAGO|nr:hypothetical protein, conserved [Plasmodium gonderi]GAW81308.1 hypothetical protein, conserved [Plasmodium gonderi]